MRRIAFIALASAVVFAFAPASALARHHRGHHRGHHGRKHHKRHSRIRRFGTTSNNANSSGDTAGHVVSFTNGVLTIELNDQSTVRGRVTDATELECRAPEGNETSNADGDRGGDNRGGDNRGDESGGDEQEGNQNCSTADLTPNAAVKEAELRISGSGSVWKKVELISPNA